MNYQILITNSRRNVQQLVGKINDLKFVACFQEIILKKGSNPLGFSIVGGSDHASHPFGMDEPGIFISKV